MKVYSMREIKAELDANGINYRPQVFAQISTVLGIAAQREREDAILANPTDYPAGLVEQIRDHRAEGNYVTGHRTACG